MTSGSVHNALMTQATANYKIFFVNLVSRSLLLDDFQNGCSSGKFPLPVILKVEKARGRNSWWNSLFHG